MERLVPVDIETTKIKFYTVSTEDVVVSKLCAARDKDIEDIESDEITKNLNWNLLDKLINDVCYGLLTEYDALPIDSASYKNVGGGTTNCYVMLGNYISKK